MKDHTH